LIELTGVPKGTTGAVMNAAPMEDGYDVVVEWDHSRYQMRRPLRD
jgi:hypothetical protein